MDELKQELVLANHILFDRQVLDAFGHVSVRSARGSTFLMARNMAPALVTIDDLIEFGLDGEPLQPSGHRPYLERFIHSEIYGSRPEVQAIVHSHSPSVVPFSVAKGSAFRAVSHMAGFLGAGVPIFDIRDKGGDGTDMLVTSPELGRHLADVLAGHAMVLMRGHGSTVVGGSLRQAVFRAVYAEANARTHIQAASLGAITFLSEAEALAAAASTEGQAGRAWDLWRKSAEITHKSLMQMS